MQEFSSVIASSYDAESLAPMLTEKASEGWSVVSIVSAGTNVVAYLTRGGDDSTSSGADAVQSAPAVESAPEPEPDDTSDAVAADATSISPTLPGESVGAPVSEPADDAPDEDAAAAVAAADEPAGWGAAPTDGSGDSGDVDTSIADLAAQVGAEDDTSPSLGGLAAGGAGAVGAAAVASETVDTGSQYTAAADEPAAAPAEEPAAAPTEEPAAAPAEEPAAGGGDSAAESTVPAGWYADPSGRFELRYWDGHAWTEHVSRAGQQYTDPPVA